MMGCPSVRPSALMFSLFNRLNYKHHVCIFTFLCCSTLRRASTIPFQKILAAEKMAIIEKVTKGSSSRVIILPSSTLIKRTGHCLALGQKSKLIFSAWRLKSPLGLVPGPEPLQPRGHKAPNQMLRWSQRENSSWKIHTIALLLPWQISLLPLYSHQANGSTPLNSHCSRP